MIKDQKLGAQILEIMDTAVEAVEEMKQLLIAGQQRVFRQMGEDLYVMLKSVQNLAEELKQQEPALNLYAFSESALVSLKRILVYANLFEERAVKKLEFELLPLLENMRLHFFFWGTVYPDKEKMQKYYDEDIHRLGSNRYIAKAMKTGEYKYDISIIVTGYNKVEYTKICLESLYQNLPEGLRYEIILVNHGSNDGTQELFEQYQPDKQIDIAVNGAGFGLSPKIAEGKYVLGISNDIVIGKNALINLYKCIKSDEKIVWAVPATSNIGNLQMISCEYTTQEELQAFVEKNNQSDSCRWEQRARLNDPISITRMSYYEKAKDWCRYHTARPLSFPDDRRALFIRRNGYKMYLVKDAFCHHFGSVTLKENKEITSEEALLQGRKEFKNAFGQEPWQESACYSPSLIGKLSCENQGKVHILGIDCGIGSNPLKIKEKIKENVRNKNCFIKNMLTSDELYLDAKSLSDEVMLIISHEQVKEETEKYDYVIDEPVLETETLFYKELELCSRVVAKHGFIVLRTTADVASHLEKDSELKEKFNSVIFAPVVKGEFYENGTVWIILSNE